jgi:hypothetical protein
MLSFGELFNNKKTELEIIAASLVRTAPPKPYPESSSNGKPETVTEKIPNKLFKSKLPANKLKVSEYKLWLQQELQKLAHAADSDDIELNN